MSMQSMMPDMAACVRCSSCKWIPQNQIKNWRFAYGCPSVSRYNIHSYSGSGKMMMGLSRLYGRSEWSVEVVETIYRCQMCGLCNTSCNVVRNNIDLADVLYELRAQCVEDGVGIPAHANMLKGMRQEGNTLGAPREERGDWLQDLELSPNGREKASVLFHAGCRYSYDSELRDTLRGMVSILKVAGVDFAAAGKEEGCCGGMAFDIGHQEQVKSSAQAMARQIKRFGARVLVTPCSYCYYAFKYLFPKRGLDLGVEVRHITEYLDSLIKKGALLPGLEVPVKATYHDPCHLGRRGEAYKEKWEGDDKLNRPVKYKQTGSEGVFDPPRDILRAIPGLELVEMERIREYSWCCGAGGGVLDAYPEFARWTANERIEEARTTGAEALVSACPWCARIFRDTCAENGEAIRYYDVTELLAMSLGGV